MYYRQSFLPDLIQSAVFDDRSFTPCCFLLSLDLGFGLIVFLSFSL